MMIKVLVVEDSVTVCKVLFHLFQQEVGIEVEFAKDFQTAKALMEKTDYFAALCDRCLPDAPNGEVIEWTLAKGIPAIVLTARMDEDERTRLQGLGVVDYVLKENRFSYQYAVGLVKRLARNGDYRVLVVDDSQVARKQVKDLLERHQFQVAEADSAEAALIQLATGEFKLMITDYEMPAINGVELICKVREQVDRDELIIVGLSGREEVSARFIKYGANDFLRKPFFAEEFYCRINNLIQAQELNQKLWQRAHLDYLTGVANRRYLMNQLHDLWGQAVAAEQPLCLAMLDVDMFKQVNDRHGHQVGDRVLQFLARELSQSLERFVVGRVGGEEFAVVMPGLNGEQAWRLIEAVRRKVTGQPLQLEALSLAVSFSAGICQGQQGDSIDTMLRRADEVMYQAKEAGRNLVLLEEESG
ncbi:diguanylate cyclase [Ferrimonas sp. SCSIO 43195]|uniref:diguanylate cyclase n=1 Tax=Ferrimonas sp. SCSIO 43195 TaxID=2822844 RepID=UPI002074F2B0|nr:diguanylate cyclase [Ferrimonas sp. SCSIO 43195]USD35964.1 diguanylate cyclase [Ferrimonas sp. SCSIO 43195]